jgi:hypothetical protein
VSEIADLPEIGQDEKPETRWVLLIKKLRSIRGCSISEAQHDILSDVLWRRWAVQRANQSPRCAKEARLYVRDIGAKAFLKKDGDRFVVRQRDE